MYQSLKVLPGMVILAINLDPLEGVEVEQTKTEPVKPSLR